MKFKGNRRGIESEYLVVIYVRIILVMKGEMNQKDSALVSNTDY